MPAYVIAEIQVEDQEAYERYKMMHPPIMEAFGGRFLARGGAIELLEGAWNPKRLVVIEFPDVVTARRWWESPEYAKAKAIRQSATHTNMILLEGLPRGL